jgi:hypothetical protein
MRIDRDVRPRAQLSGLDIYAAIGIACLVTFRERLPGELLCPGPLLPRAYPESNSPDSPPPVNARPNSGAEPHLDNYRYLVFSSPITSETLRPTLLVVFLRFHFNSTSAFYTRYHGRHKLLLTSFEEGRWSCLRCMADASRIQRLKSTCQPRFRLDPCGL